jgi:hypothetical protein
MNAPPDNLPQKIKGTLKAFKSLDDFFSFFNSMQISDQLIPNSSQTYSELLDWTINTYASNESMVRENDLTWLGEPYPVSVEDALARDTYLRMDEFNDVYKTSIQPRIQEILRQSSAELELPTIKYNELGLGTFDFNKASGGLIPLYKYYSFEKMELVDGSDVANYNVDGVVKYKLKSDGTPVVLVPKLKSGYDKDLVNNAFKEVLEGANIFEVLKKYDLKIGGTEAFSSTIKKSYILKEKVPKPKNAVRIFIKIGAAYSISAEQYKWTGYLAVGISELLSIMGYSVNIIAVYGTQGNPGLDTRFFGINLKRFDETLDKLSLLYTASDPTFFRVRCFSDVLVKLAQFYNDYIDDGLGYVSGIRDIENMVYNEYGKRDGYFNMKGQIDPKSQFLYYVIGDVLGQDDLNSKILEIGLDVVNRNRIAREKLIGV